MFDVEVIAVEILKMNSEAEIVTMIQGHYYFLMFIFCFNVMLLKRARLTILESDILATEHMQHIL